MAVCLVNPEMAGHWAVVGLEEELSKGGRNNNQLDSSGSPDQGSCCCDCSAGVEPEDWIRGSMELLDELGTEGIACLG